MAMVMGMVGGSQKDKTSTSGQSETISRVEVDEAGADETAARKSAFDSQQGLDARLKELENLPAIQNLEKLLNEMGSGPSAERINSSNQFASAMFKPQQEQLNQSLDQQRMQFANTAAQMGRSSSDPIMAAKLAQEQVRQQARLSAEQGAFAANEAMTGASRQFGQQFTGLNSLSQNAIQNRQAVYSMGSDFANTQQQFRLATATRVNGTQSFGDQYGGGGLKGSMTGGMAGMATDAKIMQSIMSMSGSDERIKTDIQPEEAGMIVALRKIKPYSYNYKEAKHGEGRRVGVMAQDLEKSFLGNLITEEKDGVKYIDNNKAVSFLLASVAELQRQLDDMRDA